MKEITFIETHYTASRTLTSRGGRVHNTSHGAQGVKFIVSSRAAGPFSLQFIPVWLGRSMAITFGRRADKRAP